MQGRVFKRCGCPRAKGASGDRTACKKQHGSWSFVVDVPGGAGRRRQVTRGGFPTRQGAEAALAEFVAIGDTKPAMNRGSQTLGEYLEEWLALVRPTLAASAWTSYRVMLRNYVIPHLGGYPVATLPPARVAMVYADLLRSGGRGGRPLSATTVRSTHRVLRKALNDAIDLGVVPVNPIARVKPPRPVRREMRVWTAEEATRFLRAAADDRLYPAWLLALSCGLRRGELAGLRWTDVDLAGATLTIATQRTTDVDGGVLIKEPKGTSRRTIDLGPAAVEALRRLKTQTAEERLALGPAYVDTGLVFVEPDGSVTHPQVLTDRFQRLARQVGVPVIRLHDARHSCATLALSAGIHPKVVQQLLGHSSWAITMDLYSHRVDRLQREAVARIETLLTPQSTAI